MYETCSRHHPPIYSTSTSSIRRSAYPWSTHASIHILNHLQPDIRRMRFVVLQIPFHGPPVSSARVDERDGSRAPRSSTDRHAHHVVVQRRVGSNPSRTQRRQLRHRAQFRVRLFRKHRRLRFALHPFGHLQVLEINQPPHERPFVSLVVLHLVEVHHVPRRSKLLLKLRIQVSLFEKGFEFALKRRIVEHGLQLTFVLHDRAVPLSPFLVVLASHNPVVRLLSLLRLQLSIQRRVV